MELAKIEQLLDRFFEGETTLAEEQVLRDYFKKGNLPPHLAMYTPIFQGFEIAKEESSSKEIVLPQQKKPTIWMWSVAASLILAIGIGSMMYFQNQGLTNEQQEALAAYKEAQATMMLLSENLNKGASKITYLDAFNDGTSTINLLNEFTETKDRFLK